MKNSQIIENYWNTTDDYEDYPNQIKKIFQIIYISEERKFNEWIKQISLKYKSDIDWWIVLPVSRNPYVSELYKTVCIIKTLKILKSKKILPKKILVSSDHIKKIVNESFDIKIISKKKSIYYKFFFLKNLKAAILFLLNYILVNLLSKQNKIKNELLTLIDTFIISEKYQETSFYGVLYQKYLKKKKNYYFVPTLIYKSFFYYIKKILKLKPTKYLFKEHYLKPKDIIYCLNHICRKNKFLVSYKNYYGINLDPLIHKELKYNSDYFSIFQSLANYLFTKRLKENKIRLKKVINWYENQPIDKAWNYGFKKFYSETDIIGYQGMLNAPMYHCLSPTENEVKLNLTPKKIIVINKSLIQERSKFTKIKEIFQIGPALRFNEIFKSKIPQKKKNIITIFLEGINEKKDLKMLNKFIQIAKKIPEVHFQVKEHPRMILNKLKVDVPANLKFKYNKFSILAKNSAISACIGATSTVIESLAYGCFLIIPSNSGYEKIILKNLNIPNQFFKICSNEKEITDTIKAYLKRPKKIKSNLLKKHLFEKITNENIKVFT